MMLTHPQRISFLIKMASRRMEKAVSWIDDAYWAAWDKWDEIIQWEDDLVSSRNGGLDAGVAETAVEESLQYYQKKKCRKTKNQTPAAEEKRAEVGLRPKVETEGFMKLQQVEVAKVEGGKVIIRVRDEKNLKIEDLDIEIGLTDLQEFKGDAHFEIVGLDIGDVIVEVVEDDIQETEIKVEVTEVEFANCDGVPLNDVAVDICDLLMKEVQLRQDDFHENEAGRVKVAAKGGNVVELPLKTSGTRRRKKKRRQS
ncbi:uncharacterized protein [Paramormyrops kingsleyae]|uniref:uncharacterized protein isoform X1 n=1 Tax=Paramormyrops kingsleyae TaxID=1676925 RepID=UPI003B97ADF4